MSLKTEKCPQKIEPQSNQKTTSWEELEKVPFAATSGNIPSLWPSNHTPQTTRDNSPRQDTGKKQSNQYGWLVEAMDEHRKSKTKQFRAERAQELTERKFNNMMTSPDELEFAVLSGEEGISMREIEYQGKTIKIYELKGYPARFLQHTVDYKTKGSVGYDRSSEIIQDPSKWTTSKEEMIKSDAWLSDNISTSYVDCNINLGRRGGVRSEKGIVYGFSLIPSGTLIKLTAGDGRTARNTATHKTHITTYEDPTALADSRQYSDYNEVVIHRYNEKGEAILPDYMIAHERGPYQDRDLITEHTLRHAAYFGIPIIWIYDNVYREKAFEEMAASIERLSEDDPYPELYTALQSVTTTNMYIDDLYPMHGGLFPEERHNIPRNRDHSELLPNGVGEKLRYLITEVEPIKRINYIERSLLDSDSTQIIIEKGIATIGKDEIGRPLYGEQITIKMPGVPETTIKSNDPNYYRIKIAAEKYAERSTQ